MRRLEREARRAAARAGALIRARHGPPQVVACKGRSPVDLVTATDREAETLIVQTVRRAFPDHGIVSEESPPVTGRGPYRWYVDPLDGTTNFAHGYPHCAVSIAVEHEGVLVLGLVHDPIRRETFCARRGGGATLNGRPIRVSTTGALSRALVATGFPPDRRRRAAWYGAMIGAALRQVRCLRRSGSAALDLSYVACGRLDAYWEPRLGPWDAAAGRLLVEEAGGTVTNFRGMAHDLAGAETAASNGRLHRALLRLLRAGDTDATGPRPPR